MLLLFIIYFLSISYFLLIILYFAKRNNSAPQHLLIIQICNIFFLSQPRYKESQVYLARFKQCLSRALTLIKSHVITILQNASQQVLPRKVS